MTPTRRRAAGSAAVLAVALLAAACADPAAGDDGTAGDGDPLRPVTIALDWTPNTNHGGLYLAQERGWFADAGLDVEILEPGEVSGLQALAGGHADLAYTVAEAVVPARAQGVDVVSVAAVIEENTSSLISLAATGISRPRELAGKVYGSYGSALEVALVRTLVACDGGDADAVTTVPLASDDMRIGLTQHQYDYVWVFDAWDTLRLREVDGLDVATIPFAEHTDCIPNWYTPLVATTDRELATDRDAIEDTLAVLARGYREAMTDPDAAADALLAAAPELDPALVRASAAYLAERYAADPDAWGRQDAATWAAFVAFLEDNGLVEPGVDVDALWTGDVLGTDGTPGA